MRTNRISIPLAVCAIALIFIGAVSLAGWWLELPYLVKMTPKASVVQPNSAVCLLLAGLTISSFASRNWLIGVVCNTGIFVISFITLLEYLADLGLGADTLFVINPTFLNVLDVFNYRMAPNTAFGFFLFSVFIFLKAFRLDKQKALIFFIPCIYGVIGLVSLVGFMLSINDAYAWGSLRVISPQSSLGLILMAFSSIALSSSYLGNDDERVVKILEYCLFSGVLLFVLILWQAVRLNYVSFIKSESQNELKQLSIKMATEIENEVEAIIRLFSRLNNQAYTSQSVIQRDIANYFKHIKPLVYVGTKVGQSYWAYYSPNIDKTLMNEALRYCRTSPANNLHIAAFGEYLCVKDRNNIALFDAVSVIREFFKQGIAGHFIVRIQLDGETIYVTDESEPEYQRYWNVTKTFDLYGKNILLIAQPTPEYVGAGIGKTPSLIFALGIVIAFSTLFALRYRRNLLEQQRTLIASENLKDTLLNSTLEGIIGVDKDLRITFMNSSAKKMLGYDIDTETLYFGRLLKTRRSLDNTTDSDEILLNTLISGKSIKKDADTFFRKDGSALPVNYSCSPLFVGDDIVGALIVFSDNTERMKLEDILRKMALNDSLTGLPNRAHFMKHLEEQLQHLKKQHIPFSLCYIDINDFKTINDTYGHHVGDIALKFVADNVTKALRKNDFFARLSGDEFCLIISGTNKMEEIEKVLHKIRLMTEKPIEIEHHRIKLKLSIGVVSAIADETAVDLMIRADKAMYASKKAR